MPPEIPTTEPEQVIAGDTWQWRRAFSRYPVSEGWVLSYKFRGVGTLDTLAGEITNDGSTFKILIPAARTVVAAGAYQWFAIVAGAGAYAGQRFTADSGTLRVLADPATAAAGALQTHAERTLAMIEAALEGRIPAGAESYTIGGRQLSKIPIADLYNLRTKYHQEVARQRKPDQLGKDVHFVFTRPS